MIPQNTASTLNVQHSAFGVQCRRTRASHLNVGPCAPAFTLVELLVVITIIAVLLSMLTPALDRAIYQAELAMCAANQRGIITGVTSYAMEYSRHYPHRGIHDSDAQYRKPNLVRAGIATGAQSDDLAVIRPWVPLKLMLDPLNGGLTVDIIDDSLPGTNININYMLWWDWQFTKSNSVKRSTRLGQTFNYDTDEFDVLTSEEDMMQESNRSHSGHQNAKGTAWMEVVKDGLVTPQGTETLSRWRDGYARSEIDANYGYQDGSVSRMTGVQFDEYLREDRLVGVPDKTDRSRGGINQQIPVKGKR